jgi:malonyl CoA-acyl carrier protein transacylase
VPLLIGHQVRLAVAGAFHTDYMSPAVERLQKVLAEIDVSSRDSARIPSCLQACSSLGASVSGRKVWHLYWDRWRGLKTEGASPGCICNCRGGLKRFWPIAGWLTVRDVVAWQFKKPRIPVISNVDARPHSDPAVIKQILTRQVGC